MNKEYKYTYCCNDIARIFSGSVTCIDNVNEKDSHVEVQKYLKNTYKDSNCNIYLRDVKETEMKPDICHKQKSVINSVIFYK